MSTATFDAFTRRAADGVSRRASLMTLGGAVLAAVAANPTIAEAKKNKKTKKKAKMKAKQQCQQQVAECQTSIQTFCQQQFNNGSASGCESLLQPCCQLMANCNIGAGVTCIAQTFYSAP